MNGSDGFLDKLYVVRHGETAWSKTGRHTGKTDLSLTEQGQRDAGLLRERLQALDVDHVFTSPLTRAKQTCELSGFADRATVLDDLIEWDYGDYEGLTSAQIRARDPQWDLFCDGCPKGESAAEIGARADRLITRLRALSGSALVFSSGHISRVLAARWLACEVSFARFLALDPTSISLLGYEHGRADPAIRLWNELRVAAKH